MGKYFGTDGVRGVANSTLTTDLAFQLGRAGAHVLTTLGHQPTILVGKDTRLSGDMLEAAMIAGMCSVGANVVRLGVLPTPAVAYLTRTLGMDAGVMISASHNPYYDNGIKFFNSKGYKLSDAIEAQIEEIIDQNRPIKACVNDEIGREVFLPDAHRQYVDALVGACGVRLDGMEVVLDCANGSAGAYAPEVFRKLGATVHAYYCEPNGVNINDGCGSTHIGALQALAQKHGCVGFAFDGDADRMIAVDEDGQKVDGDFVMAICAREMKKHGTLAKNTVVATVMSNIGLAECFERERINLVRTGVGDRYVLEHMVENGYTLGGEESGHIIFLDYSTTGDGILAALKVAAAMRANDLPLGTLKQCMNKYPQILVNVRVDKEKMDYQSKPAVMDAIASVEKAMGQAGRVLVRPSGTEPLIRIMLEGPEQKMIADYASQIEQAMVQELL